ncbi:hypothetical protein M9Q43_05575 [Flavobacterium sp. HXWNR29]|uniref:hypothetical protein n=1 Tax=Flavobacterium odoriferum TaxID=2946604 RepID=UPI0021CB4223|nr:hypothetical protein [Flavobacterium sp. HXWNR29]MCU4188633.1 hypothetical protein [Flavobacterium sp. HXWNR29]
MLVNIFITAIFFIWGVASIKMQLSTSKILKYNFYGYLPYCRFFAPDPVSHDTRFYIRGFDVDGQSSSWKEPVAEKRLAMYYLWNPTSRLEKALLTNVKELKTYLDNREIIHLSFPYIKLLNVAAGCIKEDGSSTHVQFMITKHTGFENTTRECLFMSSIHKLK